MPVLSCMVHEAGRISRNRPAFLAEDVRICYGEWDLMVSATARLLREAGIQPKQRVALYMESGWASATLIMALIRVGAVACPLNTRLPVHAVNQQMQLIAAHQLIARVSAESQQVLTDMTCLDPDGLVSRELTTGQGDDEFQIDLNQPAAIIFTSGSSGQPKAAQLSYGNLYYSAYGANLHLQLRSDSCWLLSLPLYHVGGLGILFRCMQTGAAMGIPTFGQRLEEAMPAFPATHLSVVPTQLQRLLDANLPAENVKRLKVVLLGGAPAPQELVDQARAAKWPVLRTYGLTEMSSLVAASKPFDPVERLRSSGCVVRHREIKIAADGEILVRGATRFQGYVEAERLEQLFDQDGWYATGDIGSLDEQGYLTVCGRKDRMFISGGENIHPEEIEQRLTALPQVRQAVVRPVADAEFGQRPVAFVDQTEEGSFDECEKFLREHLPAYKVPIRWYAWPESIQNQPDEKIRPADFDTYIK